MALPALKLSSIYDQLPVPNADGPARRSRLALCRPSADTLKLGPGLLVIPSSERMDRLGVWGVGRGISPAGPPRQTP